MISIEIIHTTRSLHKLRSPHVCIIVFLVNHKNGSNGIGWYTGSPPTVHKLFHGNDSALLCRSKLHAVSGV